MAFSGVGLTDRQAALVWAWLPNATLTRDLSWGQVDTVVLQLASGGASYIVKAAGATDHHIGREITAHETATGPLVAIGRAARLVAADRDASILVTAYLDGDLVEGSPAEHDPETYLQAGRLLRTFHAQMGRVDDSAEERATMKALEWLNAKHRIAPGSESKAREILAAYEPSATMVVPTHGDWHPRNWLIDRGEVKVIDFGRFAFRPPMTDFCRMAAQQWRDNHELELAFFEGYGEDPRERDKWRILMLQEAIGTAVWAYQVDDQPFETQGHRMLKDALAAF